MYRVFVTAEPVCCAGLPFASQYKYSGKQNNVNLILIGCQLLTNGLGVHTRVSGDPTPTPGGQKGDRIPPFKPADTIVPRLLHTIVTTDHDKRWMPNYPNARNAGGVGVSGKWYGWS